MPSFFHNGKIVRDMNKDLLERMLLLDNFVVEKVTGVDDVPVYIRPLYIELLSLNPSMQRELAQDISAQIRKWAPEVLYTVEASILPIASLVSQELDIPLSIIRKPRNFKHESDEPRIYISDELKGRPGVLFDDAAWSGYTMHYVFEFFRELGIPWPQCYFVFDFMDFDEGGNKLTEEERAFLRNRRSWVGYREVVGVAHRLDLISEHAYTHTMSLFNDDEDRAVSRAPHDRRVA